MTTNLVREALDELLRRHPDFDVVSIDWQIGSTAWVPAKVPALPKHDGPWVLVSLGQPSEEFEQVPAWAVWRYAIFKRTGALHSLADGAVSDDPFWEPQHSGRGNRPTPSTYAEVAHHLRAMAELVEAGDSFEGSLEYQMPDVPAWAMRGEPEPEGWEQPEVLFRCVYRIGNSMGQGGVRIVGSVNDAP